MVKDSKVTLSIPGAEVDLNTVGSGSFSAEIPFNLFKNICSDRYERDQSYSFMFAPGQIAINGVLCQYPDIFFKELTSDTGSNQVSSLEKSFQRYPLLAIYYELKKYPPNTLMTRRYLEGSTQIENILKKVDKLLQPLGMGRHTIEKVLDDRSQTPLQLEHRRNSSSRG